MAQIEIDIGELAKAKKRVYVKATATKKSHYRMQESGKKVETKVKEPWQLPITTFVNNYVNSESGIDKEPSDAKVQQLRMIYTEKAVEIHANAMKEAVASGKKIPKTVLKDYPQYK